LNRQVAKVANTSKETIEFRLFLLGEVGFLYKILFLLALSAFCSFERRI